MTDVTAWVDAYRRAWEETDADAAARLFAEDATYRSNIFEDPHVGRQGVHSYWSEVTATQRDVRVRMGTPVVEGNRVAVEFWTTVENDGTEITLPGCLLLTFDEGGLCRTLHEYYTFAEGRLEPPPEFGGGTA